MVLKFNILQIVDIDKENMVRRKSAWLCNNLTPPDRTVLSQKQTGKKWVVLDQYGEVSQKSK